MTPSCPQHIRHAEKLLYVLIFQLLGIIFIFVQPKVTHGGDPMSGQNVIELVYEHVLALLLLLIHLEPSIEFVETLLMSFVPGFEFFEPGLNHRVYGAALVGRTDVLRTPHHFSTHLLEFKELAIMLGDSHYEVHLLGSRP